MRYRLIGTDIEIANASGQVTWRGRPLGYPVKKVIPLFTEDGCIVLCDPDAQMGGQFENVLRIAADGSLSWRAPLPSSANDDCYTDIGYESDALVANSWSGYRVRIHPSSGRIVDASFAK
jgi:hypothetical protein